MSFKEDKRILIVAYYWPPSGGAAVQRWLKMVKYLRRIGYKPIVYTPSNPYHTEIDETLLSDIPSDIEIIKQPIWEPYSLFKRFAKVKNDRDVSIGVFEKSKKQSFTKKLSIWVRGNFFIPDARMFWIKPSVKFLSNYIHDNNIQRLVTTGTPHSMHLIGLGVKKNTGVHWTADFRDPWTDIYYHKDMMLTKWADDKHKKMEIDVLTNANWVVTASPNMNKGLEEKGASRIKAITNGFDPDDFEGKRANPTSKFTITHIGTIYKARNPINLWKSLADLINENASLAEDLEIRLIGRTHDSVLASLESFGLKKYVNELGYLSHDQITDHQLSSWVHLLLMSPHEGETIPGKLFELFASRRPILSTTLPDWAPSKLIEKEKAGMVVGFDDNPEIKSFLSKQYQHFLNKDFRLLEMDDYKYSREYLAKELVELIS